MAPTVRRGSGADKRIHPGEKPLRVKTQERPARMLRAVEETRYRIVVRGTLTPGFGAAFEGVTVERLPGATALEGSFADQAELYGILERLRNLGIELMSVNAVG
jgi:hypothetical protein